jgi:hypothetical protein
MLFMLNYNTRQGAATFTDQAKSKVIKDAEKRLLIQMAKTF